MLELRTVLFLVVLSASIDLSYQKKIMKLNLQTTTTETKTKAEETNEKLVLNKNETEKLNVTGRQFIPNQAPVVTVVQNVSPIKPFLIQQPVVSWTGEVIIENSIGGKQIHSLLFLSLVRFFKAFNLN
jgi:hypothetical protein